MEGYRDDYQPGAIPDVLYINSYPNNYIYHNKIKIDKQIQLEKELREQRNLQIQQEKEKRFFWKKLGICFSCILCFFCCI